jgi:long-subunit acyl-CoA synthetase (AMP-forming)
MGPAALSSVLEALGADASPVVLSRGHGVWDAEGTRFGVEVLGLAAALSGYGLRAGACAAVLGSEGRGTLGAGLAVIVAGAALVPLEPTISDEALRRVLVSTGAVHALASDERQLARIVALRPELSNLELVLLMSSDRSERKPAALLAETAMRVGAASLVVDPGGLRRAVAESEGGTACFAVGAAGEVRPIGRTALLALADAIARTLAVERGTAVLVALPVDRVERLAASLAAVCRGATILLADPAERPDAGLREHPADRILLDVEGLTRLYRAWIEEIEAKSWIGRGVTRWALRHGGSSERHQWRHRLAEAFVLRGMRDKLGGRAGVIDVIAGGGRRASSDVDALFAATGLALRYLSLGTVVANSSKGRPESLR